MCNESLLNTLFRQCLLALWLLFANSNREAAAQGSATDIRTWEEITGAGVTVGIVDTDFDLTNPELAGRLTKEVYSRPGNSANAGFFGAPGTGDSHGTLVAEVLGGRHSGIAPEVQMAGIASGWDENILLEEAINHRLYDQGIRIFNQSNSLGSIEQSVNGTSSVNSTTYRDRYAAFVAKGSLFVWSTGNSGWFQPTMTAGLPVLFPELQTGWLAVTAINAVAGTHGLRGVISNYANSCGVAANWCLAAAGDFVSPSSGQREFGTSFAVPLVSGTAALVQQVYPWMNADLLRQTIL